jgi:hypothetical protein
MDKLTLEMAKEMRLTPIGCVKYYFHDLTDEDVRYLLGNVPKVYLQCSHP